MCNHHIHKYELRIVGSIYHEKCKYICACGKEQPLLEHVQDVIDCWKTIF